RRHTRFSRDWSSDVCSSDLAAPPSARYDPALAPLTGRDFELLAASPPRPPVDDPAFYAWYAAQQAGAPVAGAGGAEPPPRGSAGDGRAAWGGRGGVWGVGGR